MVALILHPYCALFPQMGEAELNNLTDDIKANGFRPDQPIVKMSDGSILDGRNRALAAERAGVDPVMIIYDPAIHGADPLAFVVSRNLARRHLTDIQRAMIGAEIATMKHGGYRHGEVKSVQTDLTVTQSKAAELMNVSKTAVESAGALKNYAEPNIIDMVKTGKAGLQPAARVARMTPREEQANLTPADVTRIHQDRKNGKTSATPKQRERQPSVAAAQREQMLLNRPKLKPVDNGRPRGAEALEQAPGRPPGMTKGMAYTEEHGRVEIRTHEEVARAKLYDRFIELNALIRKIINSDAPTYDDLATLDARRRNNVLHEWRKQRTALYAILDAAIGHSKMSETDDLAPRSANDEMASSG